MILSLGTIVFVAVLDKYCFFGDRVDWIDASKVD